MPELYKYAFHHASGGTINDAELIAIGQQLSARLKRVSSDQTLTCLHLTNEFSKALRFPPYAGRYKSIITGDTARETLDTLRSEYSDRKIVVLTAEQDMASAARRRGMIVVSPLHSPFLLPPLINGC